MKFKKILALLLSAALAAPCCAVAASADIVDAEETASKTYTYYFLAPFDWFDTSCGALNEDIGCYWWEPEERAEWPGVKMTPAPEVGKNVFKITDVPYEATTIIFNSYVDLLDTSVAPYSFSTMNINTEGYDEMDVQGMYEGCEVTDNFDGYIFVLDLDYDFSGYDNYSVYPGAWFKLDEYKNYSDYYGTYNIDQHKSACTYYFAAPDNWFKAEAGAENSDIGAALFSYFGDYGGYDLFEPVYETMTPAPEVGENVFKLENVPYKYNYIRFYDGTSLEPHSVGGETVYSTFLVSTRGYNIHSTYCPYDSSFKCTSSDELVYVLNRNDVHNAGNWQENIRVQGGAWFTKDNYKNYAKYYGTYGLPDSPEYDVGSSTFYFLLPKDWYDIANEDVNGNKEIVLADNDHLSYEGTVLTPAPEIGQDVYAARGVTPPEKATMSFVTLTAQDVPEKSTRPLDMSGYDGNCPYDKSVKTDSFDGWIFVLDGSTDLFGDAFGAWFKPDDYKHYADYYGSYGFEVETPDTPDTPDTPAVPHADQRFTLYFLAPDSWIKTEAGAVNDKVGCLIERHSDGALYLGRPGAEMTPAPEVGENVFKLSGLLPEDFSIVFDDYLPDYFDPYLPLWDEAAKLSLPFEVEVDEDGSCPYDGMIYVLNLHDHVTLPDVEPTDSGCRGKWFTLEDYKTGEDSELYYATYDLEKPVEVTYYFLAPDSWFDTEKGALDENVYCSTYIFDRPQVFPGDKMTPAPENGENVFKFTVTKYEKFLNFYSYAESYRDENGKPIIELVKAVRNTNGIDIGTYRTEGYHGDCPYDKSVTTDSFDGWIYVLDCKNAHRYVTGQIEYDLGAWFTLDDYKSHTDYYGTYPFVTGESEDDMKLFIDADYDGVTTSNDALEVLRSSLTDDEDLSYLLEIADYDFDGVITSADALGILRLSVA